ncbi:MAG: CapA family protein [Eubacteriales bacterium]|nr:CapA family protein [Eubacteriales bacterium]
MNTKDTKKRKGKTSNLHLPFGWLDGYDDQQKINLLLRYFLIAAASIVVLVALVSGVRAAVGLKKDAAGKQTSSDGVEMATPTPQAPVSVKVTLVGDCTLGTDENFDYSTSVNAYFENYGADYFLENVRSIFEQDNLTIVNFEGTLTTSDERCENLYAFKGDPSFASILSGSSVEAATVANNHSHDYGEQGFEDTLNNLMNAGITPFGYDTTAVVDANGVKVGLVGIYELYDHLEREQQLKDNIAKVKEDGAQLIIVVFHWGNEKETSPDSNQVTLGHLAIDEGAHLVVGHHSHVIQPVEKYKGRYIAYSLANFCFGGNSYPSDMDTYIFQQTFTVTGNEVAQDDNINIIPCRVSSDYDYNNYQPTPVEGEEAQRILDRVNAPIE